MSKQGLLPASTTATTTTTSTTTDSRHQHTLHYKSGILKQKTIEKEVLVRARNEEILASMQKNEKPKTYVDPPNDDEKADAGKANDSKADDGKVDDGRNADALKVNAEKAETEKVDTEIADAEKANAQKANGFTSDALKVVTAKAEIENVVTDRGDVVKNDAKNVASTETFVENAEEDEEQKKRTEAENLSKIDETADDDKSGTDGDASRDVTEKPADDIDECDAHGDAVGAVDVAFVDEEIELTFDMTKTKLQEISSTRGGDADDTLEDTYASLGVTFLELTSQMQNVLKEVTTCHETFKAATDDDDDVADVKLVDKDDLPFIDDGEQEAEAVGDAVNGDVQPTSDANNYRVQPEGNAGDGDTELDAAIEAAVTHLDHKDHVTSIQVILLVAFF